MRRISWKMMEKDKREEKARKLLKKKRENRTEKENESLDLEKENGLGWKKNV